MDLQRGRVFKELSFFIIVIGSDYVLGKSPIAEIIPGFVIGPTPPGSSTSSAPSRSPSTTARARGDTLAVARSQGLFIYDAAYLELAMRRGLPLATLDAKLKAAAEAVGVDLYEIIGPIGRRD